MKRFQALDDIPHLTVRIVDLPQSALGRRERMLRELDHLARPPLLAQLRERVHGLVDAAHVALHLAIGTNPWVANAWSMSARSAARSEGRPLAGVAANSNSLRARPSSSWAWSINISTDVEVDVPVNPSVCSG